MILLGILLITIGVVYLFRPLWIMMFFELIHRYIFKERVIILYGKKIGLIFILFGILLIGTKIKNLTNRDYLYVAHKEFYRRNFSSAERICQTILQYNPNDTEALFLLGKIYFVTERYSLAKTTFLKITKIEPSKQKEIEKYILNIDRKLETKNENKF